MFKQTLTGLNREQVAESMKQVLPARAYKKVGGSGADLTDINPAYLTEVVTSVFGFVGEGWRYDYDREDLALSTTSNGWHSANILKMTLQYAYFNEDDEMVWSEPIISNGGSDNKELNYAIRGALTNALGAAFSKLLWQMWVYQGILTHNNAPAMYDKYVEKYGSEFEDDEEAAEVKKVEVKPVQEEKKVEPKQQTKKTTPKATKGKTNGKPDLSFAEEITIPDGVFLPESIVGSTLREAVEGSQYGKTILDYLSGNSPRANGDYFKPETDEHKTLKEVAEKMLEVM